MSYIFPFDEVDKGEKIALYGAGLVGQEFYAQIKSNGYCEIVAWFDKDYEFYQKKGLEVIKPEGVDEFDFDLLVVAISDNYVATDIIDELSQKVDKKKILWKKFIEAIPDEKIIKKDMGTEVEKIFPIELVTSDNLDLAVRYLLCNDILNEIEDKDHLNLYMRYWMIIGNLHEDGVGDSKSKQGSDEFLSNFRELISLMKKDGFYKVNPILVDENNKIINGRHRCASALALEKEIWTKKVAGIHAGLRNYCWFYDNGFSTTDMQEILNGFTDMYRNCNIILLFGAIKEEWGLVQKQFAQELKIVGYIDLDFTNDYLGFENLIHDIYGDYSWDDPWKDRKVRLLQFAPLYVRLVVVSDEGKTNIDIYKKTDDIKKKLRGLFVLELGNRKDNISMHAADSYEEYMNLKRLLLSRNNLKYNSVRVIRSFRRDFIERISEIKRFLDKHFIPYSKICVIGSSGLEVYGLREAGDIDFIVHPDIADKVYKLKNELPACVEVIEKDAFILDTGLIRDCQIIDSEKLHFIFCGLKFINLDLLLNRYEYKAIHNNDAKARESADLLQLFFDYVKWFDEKKALQFQLKREADKYRWSLK